MISRFEETFIEEGILELNHVNKKIKKLKKEENTLTSYDKLHPK